MTAPKQTDTPLTDAARGRIQGSLSRIRRPEEMTLDRRHHGPRYLAAAQAYELLSLQRRVPSWWYTVGAAVAFALIYV